MANLDTASKRISSMGIGLHFIQAAPLPDGTLDQGDRQHIAVSYSGINADAPVVIVYTDFDAAIPDSHFGLSHFPRRGSAFGSSSFGFSLVPVWRLAWR